MNPATYRATVAAAYDRAPEFVARDMVAWEYLARETLQLADTLRWLHVVPVADPEPYPDARTMFADITRGTFKVSDVNHEHPVWTPSVNRAFRVVHDVLGHWATGADFSWEGELRAYRAHDKLTGGIQARHALFTEAVGQVAYAIEHGGTFGPQKVACLPQWLFWATDDVKAPTAYLVA